MMIEVHLEAQEVDKEIWKDVVGYEGLYKVSNFGRVKSLPRNGTVKYEKLLRQKVSKKGYCTVALSKHGKIKYKMVHRLVAEAFLDNPKDLPQVNHKNENKLKNYVDNLEWCDAHYNMTYGVHAERQYLSRDELGRFCSAYATGTR